MKITIDKRVFKDFHPQLRVGFIFVTDIKNTEHLQKAQDLLRETSLLAKLTHNKDSLQNHDLIAPWIVARQHFGKKSVHYHTSVERLVHTLQQGKSLVTRDTLTNLTRYIALKHLVPTGIDDFTKLDGDVTFSIANGTKSHVKKGNLFYHDGKQVLGVKLDHWKNPKTKLRKKSTEALLHIEALPPINSKQLTIILKEAKDLITMFCGGKSKVVILHKGKNSGKL
jgi:DNA/RNA-binding domain of Phe-tRNA-synthetase-like protein